MIDINAENALRLERGWPLVRAIDIDGCDHDFGVVWKRIDGRYSYCRVRRAA